MTVEYNFRVRFPKSWSMKQIEESNGLAQLREWNPNFRWGLNDKHLIEAELTDEQAMVLIINDLEVEPEPKID